MSTFLLVSLFINTCFLSDLILIESAMSPLEYFWSNLAPLFSVEISNLGSRPFKAFSKPSSLNLTTAVFSSSSTFSRIIDSEPLRVNIVSVSDSGWLDSSRVSSSCGVSDLAFLILFLVTLNSISFSSVALMSVSPTTLSFVLEAKLGRMMSS